MPVYIGVKYPLYDNFDNIQVFYNRHQANEFRRNRSVIEYQHNFGNEIWLLVALDGSEIIPFTSYDDALRYKNSACIDIDYEILHRFII